MHASWFEKVKRSDDFKHYSLFQTPGLYMLSYYDSLIDQELLQRHVVRGLQQRAPLDGDLRLEDVIRQIPIEDMLVSEEPDSILDKLLQGYALLQLKDTDNRYALINLSNHKAGYRDQNNSENEFSVVGPKVGFVENIDVNLHLLRQQLNTADLILKQISIGSVSHTKVVVAYIEGITNERHVETVLQRLKAIDFDLVFDSSQLDQIVSDNSLTPFPLFLSTERVDRVVYAMIYGQVAIFSDGSPYAITGPSTLFDFFVSPEDYYLPWILGSFFRLFRIFGVLFSVLATSIYTAVLTYHYQMIPKNSLGPIIYSRHDVPFPPVLEVIFLEIAIELLREAGARLPTKIGQTLGIVGGIVIGQASVEAALTSNVLLIIVALSALASFTTPIYKMSNTIRFLRFPFIIAASFLGGLGIMLGICFLIVHLIRLESLGTPYTAPLYPFRYKDFADSFIRSPYSVTTNRPGFLRPNKRKRYKPDQRGGSNDFDE